MKAVDVRFNYGSIRSLARFCAYRLLTIIRNQTPVVFDVEIRESAMDMGANLLSSFCSSKDPDDRDFGLYLLLRPSITPWQLRVEFCGRCLVVVDTIEPNLKEIH